MRIGVRLITNTVFIASFAVIVTTLLIGGVSYNYGKNILEEQAEDRLVLVRDLKVDSIKRYFNEVQNQAILFAHNLTIVNAMQEFDAAFPKYSSEVSAKGKDKYADTVIKHYIDAFSKDYANNNGGIAFNATPYLNLSNESTFALQYNYIFNNPYGIDKEENLDTVNDGTTYSTVHKEFHEHIKEFKDLYNFEDVFLVDPDTGNIVYTEAKGLDFTTSLKNGPYAQTALGEVFRKALQSNSADTAALSDFAPYAPSNDDQAAFVAANIFSEGKRIGVLIFQLNLTAINDIMTSSKNWKNVGLGKTGESYLIDDKKRMITVSRFFTEDPKSYIAEMKAIGVEPDVIARMQAKQTTIGLQKANTMAADQLIAGKTGFAFYKDYRGIEVLGAYEPIKVGDLNLGVICEIDKSEAFAPVKALATKVLINLIGVMVLVLGFSVIVGIGLAKQLSVPIEKLSAMIQILAKTQDLTKRIDYVAEDEIGDMAKSLNTLIESFQVTTQETIMSTQKVQLAAHKLMSLAEDLDAKEATHQYPEHSDATHEQTDAIKDAGDSLDELSSRLQVLSRQFKVFEAENERTSGW
jgi:methyl-accepting chemotaxis protein